MSIFRIPVPSLRSEIADPVQSLIVRGTTWSNRHRRVPESRVSGGSASGKMLEYVRRRDDRGYSIAVFESVIERRAQRSCARIERRLPGVNDNL